eukprot:Gb_14324 [translate_table: standard]
MAMTPILSQNQLSLPCSAYVFTSHNLNSSIVHVGTGCSSSGTTAAAISLKGPPMKEPHGQPLENYSPFAILADISRLCREGRLKEALDVLCLMDKRGIGVRSDTYVYLLEECANEKALAEGKRVHTHILANGREQDVRLGTKLVSMYVMCGSLVDARLVFDKMSKPNAFTWSEMIRGYVSNGLFNEALALYDQMQQAGTQSDSFTFPFVLKACAGLSDLQQGKEVHEYIIRSGFESNVYVGSALIDMYAKCGNIKISRQVFDKISSRNVVSWNAMIVGYAQSGYANESLKMFRQMQLDGMKPTSVTILSVLPACTQLGAIRQGKEIHAYIIRMGFQLNVSIANAFVDLYAKCGSVQIARHVFDQISQKDVVSWTSMIAGYAQNKDANEAFKLFRQMQFAGVMLDIFTITSILPTCAYLSALQQGKEIHAYTIRNGFQFDVSVANALIDMYAKCRIIDMARQVFDKMCARNLVSWTTIIACYVQSKHANEALKLFRLMQLSELKSDSVTIASVLPACAYLAALRHGKELHHYAIKTGFENDIFVASALIDMYAKCGDIELSRQVFDKMPWRNVVSWNAMITGYGLHGMGEDALTLFMQMQQTGTKPTYITFVSVLSACSHAGLVDEGWQYFESMSRDYGITPRVEHYACMVDLLGRAGHLDEAHQFIEKMPLEPDGSVWGALLGACRVHCNVELAEYVAEHLLQLEPENAANSVALSNIYAAAGRWDDVAKVRAMMKHRGLKKKPGCSWIEIKNNIHTFLVADRSHPQSECIYAMLESLHRQVKNTGYMLDANILLHNVEE